MEVHLLLKILENNILLKEVHLHWSFMDDAKRSIINILENNWGTKVKLILDCKMEKTDVKTREPIVKPATFHSKVKISLAETNADDLCRDMVESDWRFQREGSNSRFESIISLALHTVACKLLRGSSYIEFPKSFATQKAIINMKNTVFQTVRNESYQPSGEKWGARLRRTDKTINGIWLEWHLLSSKSEDNW